MSFGGNVIWHHLTKAAPEFCHALRTLGVASKELVWLHTLKEGAAFRFRTFWLLFNPKPMAYFKHSSLFLSTYFFFGIFADTAQLFLKLLRKILSTPLAASASKKLGPQNRQISSCRGSLLNSIILHIRHA